MPLSRKLLLNLTILFVTVGVCFAAGEIAVRLLGHEDINGNFIFRSRMLKPYRLPVESTRDTINRYLRGRRANFVYDPDLGWKNPSGMSGSGRTVRYHHDDAGIRCAPGDSIGLQPEEGVLRIGLFGDSFTHGDEVTFEQTWGRLLEEDLNRQGLAAEVLNFGVGGYGIGQVYLSWRHAGRRYSPHVVVFGFQALDVRRIVSIIRPIFTPNIRTIPFTKPRFILEGDRLALVNSPTLPPEEIVGVMERIDDWDLVAHEFYYGDAYRDAPWRRSRLLALFELALDNLTRKDDPGAVYSPEGEPGRLALRIIRRFREEAEAEGSRFLVVNLPTSVDVGGIGEGKPPAYDRLLEIIAESGTVIRPGAEMAREAEENGVASLFSPEGHYSAAGNRFVAEAVGDHLTAGDHAAPRR